MHCREQGNEGTESSNPHYILTFCERRLQWSERLKWTLADSATITDVYISKVNDRDCVPLIQNVSASSIEVVPMQTRILERSYDWRVADRWKVESIFFLSFREQHTYEKAESKCVSYAKVGSYSFCHTNNVTVSRSAVSVCLMSSKFSTTLRQCCHPSFGLYSIGPNFLQ